MLKPPGLGIHCCSLPRGCAASWGARFSFWWFGQVCFCLPLSPFASLFQAKGTHFPQPLGASARLHSSSSMSVLYWGAKMGCSGAVGAEERAVITSSPQRMLWLCCQGPRLADATWRTGPCRVPSGFCQPSPLGPTDWQPCPRALQHVLPMWCHLQT